MKFRAHPLAIVESRRMGDGTRVWAFAHVMDGAVVGKDCNIGENVFVEGGARIGSRVTVKNGVQVWEGVTLEDDVFVGPNATFTNDRFPRSPRSAAAGERYESKRWLERTRVCRGASIGANATILCGIEVGEYSLVAAGAVLTTTARPFEMWAGNPARRRGFVCMCGGPLKDAPEAVRCAACGRRYRKAGGKLKLQKRG